MKDGLFIEQFELLERWDVPVAVAPEVNEDTAQDSYAMYATIEAYEAEYGQGAEYQVKSMIEMLKLARDNEAEFSIHGVLPFPLEFDSKDIQRLEPELSAVIALVEAMKEEITPEELSEKIGEVPVIFLGEYPNVEEGGTFGVHTVKHATEDYEMIPVFLTKKSAKEYNRAGHPMTETTIKELKHFYHQFGIIAEPKKKYWAVMEPEK